MIMDLIIKNGIIISPSETYIADVAVKDGKIFSIGKDLEAEAEKVVDAYGKLVLPGAIDVHTHLSMPFKDTFTCDDYLSGTKAAACGGVTTVFDYPIQKRGKGIIETVEKRREICDSEACVDYAFHCCITDLNDGAILDEFKSAVDYGVTSFKCFLGYKEEGMMVDDAALFKILRKSKEVGTLTNVHAENFDLIKLNADEFLKSGQTSPWFHYLSSPEYVEADADKRAIHLANAVDAPLYIVKMADKEGLHAAIQSKMEGYPIYIETCPQYLEFTCDVYKRDDGRKFVCSPPIKTQESQDALWHAINTGMIDTIATDHSPFQSYEKDWGKDDFTKIPNGCSGVENMYPYMLSAANKGRVSFNRVVEMCCSNPAKIFGCEEKGSITIGKDADIVIYDPNKEFIISVDNMHSNCDHTIWEGKKLLGYPEQTYVRGQLVYDKGEFVGTPGFGKFVKRKSRFY